MVTQRGQPLIYTPQVDECQHIQQLTLGLQPYSGWYSTRHPPQSFSETEVGQEPENDSTGGRLAAAAIGAWCHVQTRPGPPVRLSGCDLGVMVMDLRKPSMSWDWVKGIVPVYSTHTYNTHILYKYCIYIYVVIYLYYSSIHLEHPLRVPNGSAQVVCRVVYWKPIKWS